MEKELQVRTFTVGFDTTELNAFLTGLGESVYKIDSYYSKEADAIIYMVTYWSFKIESNKNGHPFCDCGADLLENIQCKICGSEYEVQK